MDRLMLQYSESTCAVLTWAECKTTLNKFVVSHDITLGAHGVHDTLFGKLLCGFGLSQALKELQMFQVRTSHLGSGALQKGLGDYIGRSGWRSGSTSYSIGTGTGRRVTLNFGIQPGVVWVALWPDLQVGVAQVELVLFGVALEASS